MRHSLFPRANKSLNRPTVVSQTKRLEEPTKNNFASSPNHAALHTSCPDSQTRRMAQSLDHVLT